MRYLILLLLFASCEKYTPAHDTALQVLCPDSVVCKITDNSGDINETVYPGAPNTWTISGSGTCQFTGTSRPTAIITLNVNGAAHTGTGTLNYTFNY